MMRRFTRREGIIYIYIPLPSPDLSICTRCNDLPRSAEEKPRVRLIPGSIEQRGTNLREAVRGDTPFCRSASLPRFCLKHTSNNQPSPSDEFQQCFKSPYSCQEGNNGAQWISGGSYQDC